MTKCCKTCIPVCQHCLHAIYEKIEVDGCIFDGEAIGCHIKQDKNICADSWCNEFYCFRIPMMKLKGMIG